MQKEYDEDSVGCGSLVVAYVSGSYFVAALAFAGGMHHWALLAAPLSVPLFLVLLIGLIGNSELPADPLGATLACCIWCLAIAAFWFLLRNRRVTHGWRWPVAVLAFDAALAALWLMR